MTNKNFLEQLIVRLTEFLPPIVSQEDLRGLVAKSNQEPLLKRYTREISPTVDLTNDDSLQKVHDKLTQYCQSIHPHFFEQPFPDFKKAKQDLIRDLLKKFIQRTTPKEPPKRTFQIGEAIQVTLKSLNSYHIGGSCSLLTFSSVDQQYQLTVLIDLGATFEPELKGYYCRTCKQFIEDWGRCPKCGCALVSYYEQYIQPPLPKDQLWSQLQEVDLILFTHAHLDHVGCAPLLVAEGAPFYSVDVPMYCQFLVKPSMYVLLRNLHHTVTRGDLRVKINRQGEIIYDLGWNSSDLSELMRRLMTKNYENRLARGDLAFEFLNAGHEPGSSMILFNFNGVTVLYTGDFCTRKTTVLLDPVNPDQLGHYIKSKYGRLDLLITESTYIGQAEDLKSRPEAINVFSRLIRDAYDQVTAQKKPIHIIIPIYGSRISEVPLLFEAYQNHLLDELADWQRLKVIIDGVARDFWSVYKDLCIKRPYSSDTMDQLLENGFNPFLRPPAFRDDLCEYQGWFVEDQGINELQRQPHTPTLAMDEPAVYIIFTTAGMLAGGPVQYYLQEYGQNPSDLLILTGFMAPNTMGRILREEWESAEGGNINFMVSDGQIKRFITIKNRIEEVRLSHHSHQAELEDVISHLKPTHLFFIHGERKESCEELGESLKGTKTISDYAIEDYPALTILPNRIQIPCTEDITRTLLSIATKQQINFNEIFRRICKSLIGHD